MNMKWNVEFYEDAKGNIPVEDFYVSLSSKKEKAKFDWIIDLLEMMGIELEMPYARYLKDTGMWELRPASNRILYFLYDGKNTFVLLHAFRKVTQRTPSPHIEIALKRMLDYIKRSEA
ncbi:MAG: type II toxin-antitoxin system RelE/ParE family toxin [Candidatus Eremiobacteraeota bacterium]|nr:type II toxin-antitoxin system RelE/ParE family toxin [Candidatus Eremiobacteraeota bacterium]